MPVVAVPLPAGGGIVVGVDCRNGESYKTSRNRGRRVLTVSMGVGTAATATRVLLPVSELLALSLTAIVWLPEVLSVTLKVDWPPGKAAALAGSTAAESLLEKLTVPEYVVALLL